MRVEASASVENPIRYPSFDEQFKNSDFVQLGGAKIKIVNLRPEHPISDIPILLAPGWSETTATYKNSLKHIFARNDQVISLDHPRRGKAPGAEALDNANRAINPEIVSRPELHKAQNIIAALEGSNVKKVDTIAHSEGAINVAIAASLRPDLFRNIVFVSPSGMLSKDNLAKELGRYSSYLSHQGISTTLDAVDKIRQLAHAIKSNIKSKLGKESEPYKEESGWEEALLPSGEKVHKFTHNKREVPSPDTPRPHDVNFAAYVLQNPLRTLAEAQAIAKADIIESITSLGQLGIGVSIIHGVDDRLEPIKATFNTAYKKGPIDTDGNRKMPTDGYYSVRHGHDALARDTRYVDAALDALKDLSHKQAASIKA